MHFSPEMLTGQTVGKLMENDHQEYRYPDFKDGGNPEKPLHAVTQISPIGDGNDYCQKDDQ